MEFGEYRKAFFMKPLAEDEVDHSGIDPIVLEGLAQHYLVADHEKANIIAIGVDA